MTFNHKPFSQACENNKRPILDVIGPAFASVRHVLEIGSGTGQHAVFFAQEMPHLVWQTSDVVENHVGIRAWIEEANLENVRLPLELDVTMRNWPISNADAVFSANTAHIMSWPQVEQMVSGAAALLSADGAFCLYGPFNYGGRYTSDSNANFDTWLKARDPQSGIRDFEALDQLARAHGLNLDCDHPMPANNRLILWRKSDAPAS